MSDERLRLIFDLQNKASAELRKLQADLSGVKPHSGMGQVKNWFTELTTVSGRAATSIRPLSTSLSTIGVSSLAAGLSVAGLVGQFRDLAKALPALQELSRLSGISKTEIERLKQAAANLNVDPGKMQEALAGWSTEMVQFQRHQSATWHEMVQGAGGLAKKIEAEFGTNPAAAFQDYLKWLNAIPAAQMRAGKSAQEAAQVQRYWAQQGMGGVDVSQILGKGQGGWDGAYKEAAQDVGEITDALVAQAEAFDKAITKFDRSWSNLKNDLGATVLPGLTAATDSMRALFDEVKQNPALLAIGAGGAGALALRRRIMSGSKLSGAALGRAAGELTGAAGALKGAAAALAGTKPSSGAPGTVTPENEKPPGGSFDKGRGLTAGLGLAAVVANSPGMDAAGDRERDANASGLEWFGQALKRWTGATWLEDHNPFRGGAAAPRASYHTPAAYDREMRARAAGDGQDHSLDGVVVGSLGREVIHLTGTLRTAAKAAEDSPFRAAAYHPGGGSGSASSLGSHDAVADAVKAGVLAGFRELLQQQEIGAGSSMTGSGGIGPGVGVGGGASIRYGRVAGGGYRQAPASSMTAVSKDLTPEARALLDTLASGEAPDYNVMNGGGRFQDYSHHPGGRAAGRYQFLPSTWAGIMRQTGISDFKPESQDKGAWFLAQRDYRLRTGRNLQSDLGSRDPSRIAAIGQALRPTWVSLNRSFGGKYDSFLARQAAGGGGPAPGADGIRGHVVGDLKIGNETYRYGSGGVRGSAHIPWGDHEITPDAIGPWGRANNAIGISGDKMWDASLGRMRTGIEMHVAHSTNMVTEGCLAFMREQYPQLKSRVREMIAKTGHAYLHINEKGASITSSPTAEPQEEARSKIAPMPAVAPEPPRRPADVQDSRSSEPAHLHITHDQDGRVKRMTARSSDGVQITLKTGRTMVETA